VPEQAKETTATRERFEQLLLPHLDAAYNLAFWLTHRRETDAQDVVQEAFLRAWRFFPAFRGGDECAWLLAIVRNTCFTWMEKNRPGSNVPFEDELHDGPGEGLEPVERMVQQDDERMLKKALDEMPAELREVIVLRELQEFSYKEIAKVTGMPLGTVMSRLSRARDRLEQTLKPQLDKETSVGL